MTTTEKSGRTPLNMHTDSEAQPPGHIHPLNMHTDVVITSSATSSTITGPTDEGTVSVRIPAKVAAILKHKAIAVPGAAVQAAHPEPKAPHAVYVLGARAKVTGDPSDTLTITGTARIDGTLTSLVLVISASALTALRRQRDAL